MKIEDWRTSKTIVLTDCTDNSNLNHNFESKLNAC